MKKTFLILLCAFTWEIGLGQQFTLNDLFSFEYYPTGVQGGASMLDGEHFTLLTDTGIDKFSYKTFEKVGTIKSGKFTDYFFNADETFLFLETQSEPIFRRSKRSVYTLQNLRTQQETQLFNGKMIQEPALSPD